MHRRSIDCVVLKKINYGDSDKIVTLLTDELGKITVMAKGVRKISSRRAGNLDSLNYIKAQISHGSASGLKTIGEVRTIKSFRTLKQSLVKAKLAFYCIEMVNKLLEVDHPTPGVFKLVLSTIAGLNSDDLNPGLVTARFEILLLRNMGYELSLENCVVCGKVFSNTWESVKFSHELGGLCCADHTINTVALPIGTAKLLNDISKGAVKRKYSSQDLSAAAQLVKKFVYEITDYKLKSLEL